LGHRGAVVVVHPGDIRYAWGRGRLLQGGVGRLLLHQQFADSGYHNKKRTKKEVSS